MQALRARVPWLTGAASWAYSATQYILGIQLSDGLKVNPCILD
jgi:cellobiose phosphorylase